MKKKTETKIKTPEIGRVERLVRRPRHYWIKERFNPQFEKPYYVAMGQLSQAAAKKYTRPIYGDNVMHPFDTDEAYKARLIELVAKGYRVQNDNAEVSDRGKQTKAYWRSQEKWRNKWESEKPITSAEKAYGQYLRTVERIQGHAAGWSDGVRWLRRQQKSNGVFSDCGEKVQSK